jgi:signal transduction histidine kinase
MGRAFPPDKRQHAGTRHTPDSGQGIGLSVVRELAALYRGTVEIVASELGGARVVVRLLGA